MLVGMVLAVGIQADTMIASTADAHVVSTGPGDQGSVDLYRQIAFDHMHIGRDDNGDGRNFTAVMAFQLPNLGNVINPFETSALTFNLNSLDADYGVDLYGLDARTGDTVLTSDFYMGGAVDPSSDAEKLQNSILTPVTTPGAVTSTDITTWLNRQYDGGGNAGKYVFLRLSASVLSDIFDVNNGYTIASANAPGIKPALDYTYIVPEPSPMILILGAGLGFVMLRFLKRK